MRTRCFHYFPDNPVVAPRGTRAGIPANIPQAQRQFVYSKNAHQSATAFHQQKTKPDAVSR
jgi:hypothetical protein